MLLRLLRDPLSHFVIVGIVIYVLLDTLNPASSSSDGKSISVTKADLITLMQKRDQVFDQERYAQKFAELDTIARDQLIRQFFQQEALYREAKQLGLDQNDDMYRRRLIQKMKYFLEGFAKTDTSLSEEQFLAFYADNKERYRVPAQLTFSHVFFRSSAADPDLAATRARNALESLDGGEVPPSGDHFPYHKNYVAKSASQISRHFGAEFAKHIFGLTPQQQWQGPLQSAYGAHLVRLSSLKESYLPEYGEIESRLQEDALRQYLAQAKQQQIDQVSQRYQLELDAELK